MNTLGMLIGFTTLMFPIVIWIDGPPNLYIFVNSWVAVIGLAFLLIALAYILYFVTLARAGAANLLLLTLLIPPFAIYLRQLSIDERLGPKALIGLRLLLLGLQSQTNAWFHISVRHLNTEGDVKNYTNVKVRSKKKSAKPRSLYRLRFAGLFSMSLRWHHSDISSQIFRPYAPALPATWPT